MPLTIDPSDPNFIIDTDSGRRYPRPQNRRRAAADVVGQRGGSPAEAAGKYVSPGIADTAMILSQLTGAAPGLGLLGRIFKVPSLYTPMMKSLANADFRLSGAIARNRLEADRAARPMTVRGTNQWANVNPEAGMDQMFAPAIAEANAAMADPEAGMDQMYAAEIAQSLKKPTTRRVAAKGPTKAQQKIIDDAAKNYQSNSMPVLMQPQGPMKGGATMQPSINWGDANDAADFFRADALRRQMPGLLGWGGE